MDRSPVAGTWSLVSFEARGDDGAVIQPFGPDPVGMLMYDAAGHMAVQLAVRQRAPFADPTRGTPEEEHAAIASYSAYFGTYDFHDDGTLTHHTVGHVIPNLCDVDQTRLWALDGDRLTLTAERYPIGDASYALVLEWQRIA